MFDMLIGRADGKTNRSINSLNERVVPTRNDARFTIAEGYPALFLRTYGQLCTRKHVRDVSPGPRLWQNESSLTRCASLALLHAMFSPPARLSRDDAYSTMYITGRAHVAAKAMVCTTLSAASGGLGVATLGMILFHHVGPDEVMNGVRKYLSPEEPSASSFEPSY